MTRIRAWLIRLLQGVAPTVPPDSDGQDRTAHEDRRWEYPITYVTIRDPYRYWIVAQVQWVDDRTLVHRSCGRFATEEDATAFIERCTRTETP